MDVSSIRGGTRMTSQTKDRIMVLLQEVGQERRSVGAFLNPSNPCAIYFHYAYHVLEDIGGDFEKKQCMDSMYAVASQYRAAKWSGGPPPGCPRTAFQGLPMYPGTSAVPNPPSYHLPPPTHSKAEPSTTSFLPLCWITKADCMLYLAQNA